MPQASTTAKGEGFFIDMSKDPAFLFYPGDYLRDTQCLSESVQVAYDRIMCEHMRNICISQQQLNFFTKRLSDMEREELMMVLSEVDGGYQITWVAESIVKRKAYSESRSKNRSSSSKNISKTYVEHMENEIENENRDVTTIEKQKKKSENFVYPNVSDKMKLSIAEFMEHRKAKKSPIKTQLQFDKWIAKLKKMAKSEGEAIAIIDNAIANGWTGIFYVGDSGSQKDKLGQRVSVNDEIDRILTRSVNETKRLQ